MGFRILETLNKNSKNSKTQIENIFIPLCDQCIVLWTTVNYVIACIRIKFQK